MTLHLRFCILTLLSIGFCWPSEGAIQGDGLLWAFCWIALAGVASLIGYGDSVLKMRHQNLRPVILLLSGLSLSTVFVFVNGGDRRAALNLLMEWLSLGAAWYLMRILISEQQDRQAIPRMLLTMSLSVSAFGILQHYYLWPLQQDWYQQQSRQQLAGGIAARQAEQALQQLGVPNDAGERQRFEDRLLNSTEALGPFALANTLGGVLAVGCVLLMSVLAGPEFSNNKLTIRFLVVVALACLVWGMILTKSRTAWLATFCGVAFVLVQQRILQRVAMLRWGLLAGGIVVGIAVVACATGAIDREVILEAPKSVQYRLLYWAGTFGVIRNFPLVGSGLGNFREAYLRHKWPETSEEILDPHNIFLDVWCSAGLLGLVGLLWMMVMVVKSMAREKQAIPKQKKVRSKKGKSVDDLVEGSSVSLIAPVWSAVFLVKFWGWLQGGEFWSSSDDPFATSANALWTIACFAIPASWLVCRFSFQHTACGAAFGTLILHLCASGGLQITIVGLLVMALFAIVLAENARLNIPDLQSKHLRIRASILAVIAIVVLLFGVKPNVLRQYHQRIASFSSSDLQQADARFAAAVAADPLAVEPRQRRAEFWAYAVQSAARRSDLSQEFELNEFRKLVGQASDRCDALAELNSDARCHLEIRSQLLADAAAGLSDSSYLQSAIEFQKKAINSYPSSVQLWMKLAQMQHKIGDTTASRISAERTYQLEQINRRWHHSDRYLANSDLETLHRIMAGEHED